MWYGTLDSDNKKHSLKDVADFAWNKSGSAFGLYRVVKEAVKEPVKRSGNKRCLRNQIRMSHKSDEPAVKEVASNSNSAAEGVYVFQTKPMLVLAPY